MRMQLEVPLRRTPTRHLELCFEAPLRKGSSKHFQTDVGNDDCKDDDGDFARKMQKKVKSMRVMIMRMMLLMLMLMFAHVDGGDADVGER